MLEAKLNTADIDKQLGKLKNAEKAADRHLIIAMQKSTTAVEGTAKTNWPVGVSGRSRNAITSSVRKTSKSVRGRVFSTVRKYPLVVEHGRQPGSKMPPPSKLYRWVQIVMNVPAKSVKGVAFVVARRIGRKGIKGKHIFSKAYQSNKSLIISHFKRAVENIKKDISIGS